MNDQAIADLKQFITASNDRLEARFNQRLNSLELRFGKKLDGLEARVDKKLYDLEQRLTKKIDDLAQSVASAIADGHDAEQEQLDDHEIRLRRLEIASN